MAEGLLRRALQGPAMHGDRLAIDRRGLRPTRLPPVFRGFSGASVSGNGTGPMPGRGTWVRCGPAQGQGGERHRWGNQ